MLPIEQLDAEEQSIIDTLESGKLQRTKNFCISQIRSRNVRKNSSGEKSVTLRFDRTLLNRIRAQVIEE